MNGIEGSYDGIRRDYYWRTCYCVYCWKQLLIGLSLWIDRTITMKPKSVDVAAEKSSRRKKWTELLTKTRKTARETEGSLVSGRCTAQMEAAIQKRSFPRPRLTTNNDLTFWSNRFGCYFDRYGLVNGKLFTAMYFEQKNREKDHKDRNKTHWYNEPESIVCGQLLFSFTVSDPRKTREMIPKEDRNLRTPSEHSIGVMRRTLLLFVLSDGIISLYARRMNQWMTANDENLIVTIDYWHLKIFEDFLQNSTLIYPDVVIRVVVGCAWLQIHVLWF